MDYKEVLSNITSLERRTLHLYSFICELSLLNTSLCVYSPARLAAAALLLAKILHGQGEEPHLAGAAAQGIGLPCLCGEPLGVFWCSFIFSQVVWLDWGGEKGGTCLRVQNEELSSAWFTS